MRGLGENGLLRSVEYVLSEDYNREMIIDLCRGTAKGKPYLTSIYAREFMGTRTKRVVVKVYRDELSMFIACIREDADLKFYGENVPDVVN